MWFVMDIWPRTKWPASRRRSRRLAPACCTAAYSPDLNPIEQFLRQAQSAAAQGGCFAPKRRYGKPPASSLTWCRPPNAEAYLANAGYDPI